MEQALRIDPASVPALIFKAELLAAQAKDEAAQDAYRAAIRAAPKQIAPRLALIIHLLRAGSSEKASAEVTALEKIAPGDGR